MRAIRRLAATGAVLAVISVVGVWAPAEADAHVTVSATGAVQGGYAVLTFRVPTESDTASTTGLTVQLPLDHPLASVSIQPHPGWSYKTTQTALHPPVTTDDGEVSEAISVIEWKADGAATAIKPGEFDQFLVSVGPLPKVATLTFRAVQSYSDGTVVSWIEVPAAGSSAEPEHPAPSVTLAPAAGTGTAARTATAASSPRRSSEASAGAATAGIVLGAIGVVLGAAALAVTTSQRRRPSQDPRD